jgi:hypothetical protein
MMHIPTPKSPWYPCITKKLSVAKKGIAKLSLEASRWTLRT